ncbi:DsrE family protein [Caproicibacter sp.]|uniref:DsrE family protein n=1 Tax=Caproicibacter sp. TaxID=2814884 RepID=UPI00398A1A9B
MPKVVFHVDESARWPLVLANARNMVRYGREEHVSFEVEILANSQAVRQLTEKDSSGLDRQMEELSREGVCFAGCRVAMGNLNLTPGDLLPFVTTVPSGVVELALRQDEGYSYIRP